MLLYLVKHLRPKIVNATQERSKVYDGVSPPVHHELTCVISYVLNPKILDLKLEPSGKWLCWRSCQQEKHKWFYTVCFRFTDILAIKSIEKNDAVEIRSRVSSLVRIVDKTMFMIQLLRSMSVKLPVMVRDDNLGAIFMQSILLPCHASNTLTSGTSMTMNMWRVEP